MMCSINLKSKLSFKSISREDSNLIRSLRTLKCGTHLHLKLIKNRLTINGMLKNN